VLDKQPRILTLALDSSCYLAYDLERCTIYKVWQGGVILEGAAFTDKKNVQPLTWGTNYFVDSLHQCRWILRTGNSEGAVTPQYTGYTIHRNKITLAYRIPLAGSDTIYIEEEPEFIRNDESRPGLERLFSVSNMPPGVTLSIRLADSVTTLAPGKATHIVRYFDRLPTQHRPSRDIAYDHRGRYWVEKSDCLTCHEVDRATVGPSFLQIASRYPKEKTAVQYLINKVRNGGSGSWGAAAMNAHTQLADRELSAMIDYILSLRPESKASAIVQPVSTPAATVPLKPGFGSSLEGVHPSFSVTTLHSISFQPRVGGMAFLPDGRLLVTTWDSTGSVFAVRGVMTGDSTQVIAQRFASGLAEPLGITVVDGVVYVMQKQELTRLVDTDGDEVADQYEAVCNSWGVTADFHEFGFGLVHQEGYFYATLSMAMRLMANEKQQPDRGKTIRIGMDGRYEGINAGLRTPNGIGIGPDNELFVTDNQGEWLPANKLIHVKPGTFYGMRWGLPDSLTGSVVDTPPAIWMPEHEIANSPSEPILIPSGPYSGQLLHGDVTHGGIKRDFLEKVDGEYQGAVFRFTQGLAAGVNRLCWGPDSALYIGEVGMVGGWSWREKKFGLQRMTFNGRPVFEMLAIRARHNGFEIEFTEAVAKDFDASKMLVQQWWYLPTSSYGGPKKDLEQLRIADWSLSSDNKKVSIKIPGIKAGRVIYFRLPDDLRSAVGRSLWSSEAWYTLNNIPTE
jgi:cytochrome c